MGEIIKRENLEDLVKKLKMQNKTIVVTNGCFDILHIGHVKYLQKSKACADVLILLVNSDKSVRALKGETRPINPEQDRAEILCALSCVDYVTLFDENSPSELLELIKPDVYTKGADYTIETLPEAPVVMGYGGKIEFIEFEIGKSTTKIIDKMK